MLDSLGKSVLDVVGPLVDRIGSVDIQGVVPLQMLQLASGSQHQRKPTDRATPVCWEVIHGGTEGERASAADNVTSLAHDRLLHAQGQSLFHPLGAQEGASLWLCAA